VCVEHRCIYVTGLRVKMTAEMLARYLGLLARRFMCAGCGETFGEEKRKRCPKCGSGSFELAGGGATSGAKS
jgi:rubrerythrin